MWYLLHAIAALLVLGGGIFIGTTVIGAMIANDEFKHTRGEPTDPEHP